MATDNVFMLCQMGLHSPSECVRETSNSLKLIDAYWGRKKYIFTKYDLGKQY